MSDPFVTKNILKWYDLNKRSLPWRKNVSKEKRQYNTLISEFMLQQTQVATVIPYFNKFVKEIPNIKKLASVDNKKLIKLWEGLGYYSRAINLKKAAQSIIKNFNGVIPNNFDDLKSLSGIGDYTANAILAIAFNKPYIPLDGNVERIIKRYLYLKKEKEIQKENLIEKKSILGFSNRSSDYAQALMEFGALVCKPTNPLCCQCPITKKCKSFKKKDFNELVNNALNSTLSRTVNTSLTTFFVLFIIFLFGGEVIRGFMFALLVGVVVGTYSSLFVASPIMLDSTNKSKEKHK